MSLKAIINLPGHSLTICKDTTEKDMRKAARREFYSRTGKPAKEKDIIVSPA